MFKLLLKKQLYESFKSFFIDSKNGKKKTKGRITGLILLFAFAFISIGFSFFGMSMIVLPLADTDLGWLFYALFGIVAIAMGIFIDAFSASAYVFKAKDNELLLSMPIKSKDILASRMATLYIYAFVYSGSCWLPICLNTWINGSSTLCVIYDVLLLFFISLFVTALSCVIGFIFSEISKRFKNKSLISIISSILIIGIYFFTSFKLQSTFENFVLNASDTAKDMKVYAVLFYHLGKAAEGNSYSFVIFSIISILIFVLVYFVLSKSFIKIATSSSAGPKVSKIIKYKKSNNIKLALIKREVIHFLSSPTYFINTSLGSIMVLALSVFAVVKIEQINELYNSLFSLFPLYTWLLPFAVIVTIAMLLGMDFITAPSISLEGKSLWILKNLPINTYDILQGKERLALLVNSISGIISTIILCLCFKLDVFWIVSSILCIFLFVDTNALFGLIIAILRPNFDWTNEAQPIKQSLNGIFSMLFGLILPIIFIVGCYLSRNIIDAKYYLYAFMFVLVVMIICMRRWVKTKGVEIFENL